MIYMINDIYISIHACSFINTFLYMIHVYLIIYYYFFRGGEFRQEYGQLAHLRSIVPDNTMFIALTATATQSMKTEICKKQLDILECESTTVW